MSRKPRTGDRVRVGRDEARYPSKGTWPRFRGKAGTVVSVNRDAARPHLTEYGVSFGDPVRGKDGRYSESAPTWFKDYELVVT